MRNFCAILFYLSALSVVFAGDSNNVYTFRGSSDASAAVSLDKDTFIVADDENNTLRVYKIGSPRPVYSFDLTDFLSTTAEHPEADIEGAAKIGNRIYWITSHGRNKDGKIRFNRYRFFTTYCEIENERANIVPVGQARQDLLIHLLSSENPVQIDMERAAGLHSVYLNQEELEALAPKKNGLNIEALACDPNSRILYIGFRNPLHTTSAKRKEAIVVPLLNSADVVEKTANPNFGEPLLFDFNGFGIRAMEYSSFHKAFFIIAGPHDEEKIFALYKWSGRREQEPELIRRLDNLPENFTPEAIVTFDDSAKILLLSDDGSVEVKVSSPQECMEGELLDGMLCPNKFLTDPDRKTFRAVLVD